MVFGTQGEPCKTAPIGYHHYVEGERYRELRDSPEIILNPKAGKKLFSQERKEWNGNQSWTAFELDENGIYKSGPGHSFKRPWNNMGPCSS